MPLYDYECENCSHKLTDIQQSFKDEPLSFCPECKEPRLYRVVTGGIHVSVKNVNTIGQLADRNTRNNKSIIQENQHRAAENTPTQKKSWHEEHRTATNKEVQKMTEQQKHRYIMEGKK
tara:strand:+ start:5575 stop:5931 length:357 start_codon:yes stop_codon:yes gene_type:complete